MPDLLFPFNHIPIAKTDWPDHNQFKSKLISFIKTYDEKNKVDPDEVIADQIKYNLSESAPSLDFLNRAASYDDIQIPINKMVSFIKEAIERLFYELWNRQEQHVDLGTVNANIIESWYHITRYGGYHDMHSHHNTSWSGIYFLDIKECGPKNGNIRFYKPFKTTESSLEDIGLSWCLNDMLDIFPNSGEMVFFPGFLPHAALPYFGKSDRIVIAFNIIIKKG
tara:strand:- start:564 stop:1232 length:669 start_codon:yes stop_codon:yes gene_type:complete